MIRPPPRSTRTDTLFPYTTLFRAVVRMTLTAPGCGMGDILVDDVRTKLEMIPTVQETDVELVFDPPWTQNMMSDAARLRSEEHTSELQSLMRISYAVFCLKKKTQQ